MFYLNARVHFDEVELAVFIHEEFDGAGIHVADFRQRLLQHAADFRAQLGLT